MKIMVVDDEKDVQFLFEQKFRKEIRSGQVAFHFEFSGEAAFEYLKTNGTTEMVLILSDINMPGMNGLELLRNIKQDWPSMRVFMITAYDEQTNRERAEKYGADDYLAKPLDFVELKKKVLAEI